MARSCNGLNMLNRMQKQVSGALRGGAISAEEKDSIVHEQVQYQLSKKDIRTKTSL